MAAAVLPSRSRAQREADIALRERVLDTQAQQSLSTAEARSRILDADYAKESAALAKAGLLQQAGDFMLAQANQLPQMVLSFLGQGR